MLNNVQTCENSDRNMVCTFKRNEGNLVCSITADRHSGVHIKNCEKSKGTLVCSLVRK